MRVEERRISVGYPVGDAPIAGESIEPSAEPTNHTAKALDKVANDGRELREDLRLLLNQRGLPDIDRKDYVPVRPSSEPLSEGSPVLDRICLLPILRGMRRNQLILRVAQR